jgi:hypothetical protein
MRGFFFKLILIYSLVTSFSVYGQVIFKSELIGVSGFYDFNDSTFNIDVYNKTDSIIYLREYSEYLYVTDKTDSGIINIRCNSVFLPQSWPPQSDVQLFGVNSLVLLPMGVKSFKYFETYLDDPLSNKSNSPIDSFRFIYNLEFLIAKEQVKFKDDLPNYLFIQKILKENLNVYRFYGSLSLNLDEISENCYSLVLEETYFENKVKVPNLLSKESKKRIRRIKRSGRHYWWSQLFSSTQQLAK